VRILTRRPALAESLRRHVSAWGLSAVCDQSDQRLDSSDEGALVIADASTHAGTIEAAVKSGSARRLIVVASSTQIETLACGRAIDPDRVVAKPVHRQVLWAALSAAAGMRAERAREAILPTLALASFGRHVLLVEDDPVNAAVAQGYLAELGCTSVWVDSGPEAITRSAAERFDLIMMDLNMPTMDGFETTRHIREREGASEHRIPVIALTAHEARSYRDACLRAGMDDLMSKPFTLDQCADLLRRWSQGSAPRADAATPAAFGENSIILAASEIDTATVVGLKSLRGGQSDLYTKLVELFRPTSSKSIEQIQAALSAGDYASGAAICHKLGSSAANVGALAFARYVRQLEKLFCDGDAARAARIFETVRAAHAPLIEELARLQLKESA
jgi:CheY-like chemotaxis protein